MSERVTAACFSEVAQDRFPLELALNGH
jgi:hypothetical protein